MEVVQFDSDQKFPEPVLERVTEVCVATAVVTEPSNVETVKAEHTPATIEMDVGDILKMFGLGEGPGLALGTGDGVGDGDGEGDGDALDSGLGDGEADGSILGLGDGEVVSEDSAAESSSLIKDGPVQAASAVAMKNGNRAAGKLRCHRMNMITSL